uniref:Protein phosphatase 1 regulatory subunit 42 n=1 Tax=Dendroctonus ponderosae TaxID=77166 RepID=J3JXP9_DENPD|nr:unknown [Dendroctonus ponderosae]
MEKLKTKKKKSRLFDRVTHLYLQEKHLRKIPKIASGQDVQTLYLYDNDITKMENLESLSSLTSLYLQNNQIDKMENMCNLRRLKKLYLGKNRIRVLEGIECIEGLEELHVEKQNSPDNAPLCFDPRTIMSLTETLLVLNISHNKIASLRFLSPLKNLMVIDASFNDLDDMRDACQTVRNWLYLREAKLNGNPISKQHRYREEIIANAQRLETLDNKSISELSRTFIQRFEEGKLMCGPKPSINIADVVPGLPSNYPKSLQKAASASIIREIRCRQLTDLSAFDDAEPVYLSWNHLPKRRPLTKASHSALRGHKMESHKNMVISKTTIKSRKP